VSRNVRASPLALAIVLVVVGATTVIGVFAIRVVGIAAGLIVLVAVVVIIGSYLVMWRELLRMLSERMVDAAVPEPRRQRRLLFAHFAIAFGTVGAIMLAIALIGPDRA